MKTPEEIATEAMRAFTVAYDEDVEERSSTFIHEQIVAAVETDRRQRNPGAASDREERAHAALDEFDEMTTATHMEGLLAAALRPFVSRPGVIESIDQMLDRLMPALLAYDQREGLAHQGIGRAGLRFGIEAGLSAAFESWEPDDYAEPKTVAAALHRALLDRGDPATAEWVASNEDELWSYVGPLLDDIQKNHGRPDAWSPIGEQLPPVDAAAHLEADVESVIHSEARTAITARGPQEYDEHDPRL